MGVLACDRDNCKNVMCDRYSNEYGYICNECFNELRFKFPDVTIGDFMNSSKSKEKKLDYTSVLELEFISRWDENES